MSSQSEVAWIKQQITGEQTSAQRALGSSAYGNTQHRFITRRLERIGTLHDTLKKMVGENQAIQILIEAIEGMDDK